MRTQSIIILSAATLSMAACSSSSPTNLPPGQYSKSTSNTDATGTTTDTSKTTTVSTDANGNKVAVVKTKVSQDPPGLFNKTTQQNTQVYTDE